MLYPTALLADALADRLVHGYRELYGARELECADFIAVATRLTIQVSATATRSITTPTTPRW